MKTANVNLITIVTRQKISDQMAYEKIYYNGNMNEPDFLNRLFDLRSLPSSQWERRYDNAYDDIYQHTVNNSDYTDNWIYTDIRINLNHVADNLYLEFLSLTINPLVRTNDSEIQSLLNIYNNALNADGFEIIKIDEISGQGLYKGTKKLLGNAKLQSSKAEIKKYLNSAYVESKMNTMNNAIATDTDVAIGTAKDLLETVCKSILKKKAISVDTDWSLAKLIKETSSNLNFRPDQAEFPGKAEISIRQVLGGIGSIVQGVTELRNAYGTGHGRDADFKGLESKYAKLLVGVVSEIVIIFLATHGENSELIEPA